jgi:hypothetical protein
VALCRDFREVEATWIFGAMLRVWILFALLPARR